MSLQDLDESLGWCVTTLKNEIIHHIDSGKCRTDVKYLLRDIYTLGKTDESEELLIHSPLILPNDYILEVRTANRELILSLLKMWSSHKQSCINHNVPLVKQPTVRCLPYRIKGERPTAPIDYDYMCDFINTPGLRHLAFNILSHLNHDDLLRCMSTCSKWYNYIPSQRFFWCSLLMKSRQLCNGKLVNGVESPFFTITKEHDIDDLIQRSNIMKAYHCQSKFLKRHSPFTLALIEADARTVKVFLDAGLPRTGLLETGDPLEIIIDFSYTTRQSYYTPYYTDCVNSIANAPTANINLADLNPFAYACYKGQYHVVESFLLNNPYVGYNLDDEEGLAPITRACLKGRWQIVKLIARFSKYREIDIDCETIDGKNSVYHACRKNRLDVVKVLMKNGAQLTQLTHDHLTCFHFACALRQPKCKSIRLIKFVMSQASPHFLNMKTDSGKTAFMLACETGNLEAVKVIYESHNKLRMDLHCETDLGENAYDLAVLKKRTDVQKFLDESDFQIARDRKRKAADEAN